MEPGELRPSQPREGRKVKRLDLCGGTPVGMAVAALIITVEGRADGVRPVEPGQRHLDVVALAAISHLGGALEIDFRHADLLAQDHPGVALHLFEQPGHPRDRRVFERAGEGPRAVQARIGQHHAGGREISGLRRDDHRRDRQFAGKGCGMQRPGAAVAEQDEVARVAAVLDGLAAYGAGHHHGRDRKDALGKRDRAVFAGKAQPTGDAFQKRGSGGLGIEQQLAAEEPVRRQAAQQQVGIGYRRLGAAAAVADRARAGAGRARADMQPRLVVEPGDRAAARAHLDDVDHRCLDREALNVSAGVIGRVHRIAAGFDEGALGRRAPHVERDNVVQAKRIGVGGGADAAADRARLDQGDGLAAGALGRQHAAVRAHHEQRSGEPAPAQLVLEPAQIARDLRTDIGVGRRRRGALVFVPLPAQRRAGADINVRQKPAQHGDRALLVDRVGVGIEERDRDRLDVLSGHRLGGCGELVLGQR